jgi:hypothetical protein
MDRPRPVDDLRASMAETGMESLIAIQPVDEDAETDRLLDVAAMKPLPGVRRDARPDRPVVSDARRSGARTTAPGGWEAGRRS